jgi:hypothetical protein
MLITAGNEGVRAGLFAYDGTGWYRYSTVCGGHEGRIAWAGPNDFWTISDQQAAQENGRPPAEKVSLCHFVNGAVVASYAQPLGTAESYLPMDAAACVGPANCWFAGERLPGTVNVGAFHLHWDGANLSPVPSLSSPQPELADPGRSVTSLAVHQGALYEGVAVADDDIAPAEPEGEPSLVHQIFQGGAGSFFVPLFSEEPIVEASTLGGAKLAGNGEELWAVAGSALETIGSPIALRLGKGGFETVALQDPSGGFVAPGTRVGAVAAEPASGSVWVGFAKTNDFAEAPTRLTRIHADGTVDAPTILSVPSELNPAGQFKGPAAALACPAAGQCWVGTTQGWLFHLGPALPQDTDPLLHTLVTFRPPDASLPTVSPTERPEDNSGANAEKEKPPLEEPEPLPKSRPPLYGKLKTKLLAGNVLQLTFLLRVKAHVQLFAKRKGKTVAKTPRQTMEKGNRELRLKLDAKRWPTKLDLRVKEVKQVKKGKAG